MLFNVWSNSSSSSSSSSSSFATSFASSFTYSSSFFFLLRSSFSSSSSSSSSSSINYAASIQCQEEFGDHPGGSCTHLYGNLPRFLPFPFLQYQRESDLEFQILRLYIRLKGLTQLDARLAYLDYVSSWKIYGSTFFNVESVNKTIPNQVVLAVNKKGNL